MRTIFRYPLDLFETAAGQVVQMPQAAELLTIARQTRAPHGVSLWALVDPDAPIVNRTIVMSGTGFAAVPDDAKFIATWQERDGFVWHFFDQGES